MQRCAGSLLAASLAGIGGVLLAIQALPTTPDGINLRTYVLDGPHWNSAGVTTRHAAPLSVTQQRLYTLEYAITTYLVGRRPAWADNEAALIARQPSRAFVDEVHRFCFYCFGLYRKQAFQLDHINPSSRLGSINSLNYNNPANLLAVCRSCNTSKGNATLTTAWLDSKVTERQNAGIAGIESAVGESLASLAVARAARVRVLGV